MGSQEPVYISLCGVEVEVDAYNFCSPILPELLRAYQPWREASGSTWSIQGFTCGWCSAYDRLAREHGWEGQDRGDRLQRLISYWGAMEFGRMLEEYS